EFFKEGSARAFTLTHHGACPSLTFKSFGKQVGNTIHGAQRRAQNQCATRGVLQQGHQQFDELLVEVGGAGQRQLAWHVQNTLAGIVERRFPTGRVGIPKTQLTLKMTEVAFDRESGGGKHPRLIFAPISGENPRHGQGCTMQAHMGRPLFYPAYGSIVTLFPVVDIWRQSMMSLSIRLTPFKQTSSNIERSTG